MGTERRFYAEIPVQHAEQRDLHVAIAHAARRRVASEQREEQIPVGDAVAELHGAAEAVDLQQQAVEERQLAEAQRGQQHAALVQRLQQRFDRAQRRSRLLQRLHDRFPREAAVQRARC